VGELAARHGIVLHELVAQQASLEEASLEEAFMELARDAVDYQRRATHTGTVSSHGHHHQPRADRPHGGAGASAAPAGRAAACC
jgi:hypothetical protein